MRRAIVLATLLLATSAAAQQSASFKLEEHTLNNGGNPDQGVVLSSTSFRISVDAIGDAVAATGLTGTTVKVDVGFPTYYPPAGEVMSLAFTDAQTLVWGPDKATGSYSLYRDLVSSLSSLGYGTCEQQDLADPTTTDASTPPAGASFFYLVTAENRLAEEATKGFDSSDTERAGLACP